MEKKLIIVICILAFLGCQNNNAENDNLKSDFERYSITLSSHYTTIYFRLERSDSILIIKQKQNDTIMKKMMVSFSEKERSQFRNIVMSHLKPEAIRFTVNADDGSTAKFTVINGNCSLSSSFNNLPNIQSVSNDLNSYLKELNNRIEIDTFALRCIR